MTLKGIVFSLLPLLSFSAMGQALPDFSSSNSDEAAEFLMREESSLRGRDQAPTPQRQASAPAFGRILGGDESLRIEQIDSELGVPLGSFTTADDKTRLGFAYYFNSDLKDLSTISTFEGVFARRLRKVWIEGSVSKTVGRYKEITRDNPKLPDFQRPLRSDEELENTDLLTIGLGLMYRTTYIQNLINSESFFETVGASLTYNNFKDNIRPETFSGLGFKADFGIHRRVSQTLHFGGRLTYHLASVKMPQEFDDQTSSERSLLVRWVGFGVDVGFYF
jgi:hypothetical protein